MAIRRIRAICAATAGIALVTGGVLVATTAGAQTTPGTSVAAGPDPRHFRLGQAAPKATARKLAAGSATLAVSVRDRAGAAPDSDHAGYALAFDLATGELTVVPLTDGAGTAEVTASAYLVQAFVVTTGADGISSLSMPMRARVDVAGDTDVALDARGTARVDVSVDRTGAALRGGTVQVTQASPGGPIWYAADFDYPGGLFVQPTANAAGLALDVYGALTDRGAEQSPYLYNVMFHESGGIPAHPRYAARTADLAPVDVRLAGSGDAGCARLVTNGYDPDLPIGLGRSIRVDATPGDHPNAVYVTPAADVVWQLSADVGPADCSGGDYFTVGGQRFSTAVRRTVALGRAPLGPGVAAPREVPGASSAAFRQGDTLYVQVPMYTDAGLGRDGGTAGPAGDYPATTGETVLSTVAGKPLGTSDRTGFGQFTVSPESTRYVLTTSSTRNASWTNLSTSQRTSWSFTSRAAGGVTDLPLLAVRYDIELDDLNRAPAGLTGFTVYAERNGTTGRVRLASLTVDASFDDGATWRPVRLVRLGDRWVATLRHPPGPGYVSLRASATDGAGDTVEQSTIRAYARRR
ncbi:hypothetical protein ACTMTJ_43725 [Phytohabitans sp. LJ34]|uniref:hypothetical protein n=1 Tax=Phytohabitans sp. LJ34 TaxID=3452217 RepID=UPI003F8A1DFB